MKITVSKTTTKQVEIKLPYYSKNSYAYFKVINEDDGVQINTGHNNAISRGQVFVEFALDKDCVKITEEEFNQAYEDMLHKLAE